MSTTVDPLYWFCANCQTLHVAGFACGTPLQFNGSTATWTSSDTPWIILPTAPPPPPPHDFSLYAGRTYEQQIVLCSRCGNWQWAGPNPMTDMEAIPCGPRLDTNGLRVAYERACREAQRTLNFVRDKPEPPKPGPAYQNVSAVVRNIVGGWDRHPRRK